ncbi:GTP cyclohydrolase I FolE [Nisaea acidiphila]|uniref:GTP cyclohydrolase 1 n=1 Tax=Nisaea acidiphila TaxID=1862145 RepID=A0A9J7AMW5_9PROT|nr:GTP cyclohydrolase I FolE [Nisaea acidiphila]UUX48298.1 GTP cyclohydrolase I FolE [Nisaea acidiphila]
MSPYDNALRSEDAAGHDVDVKVVRQRPSREDAEAAVRTLIEWAGDDPDREGLLETPERVVRSYEELFKGYSSDPRVYLERVFEETEDYHEMVLLKNIRMESHCEHHMLPVIGKVSIAYMPHNRVVGVSKLARVVETFAKRLQIQEKMTAQIANSIQDVLQPKGVAVLVKAEHQCMTTRGVCKPGASMVTKTLTGCFKDDAELRKEFFDLVSRDD